MFNYGVAKCQKNNKGCDINFSLTQLKQMAKHGGILPLLGLLPAILGGLGAVGGLAGGIASAVNSSKQTAEAQRHNKEMENITKQATGEGIKKNGRCIKKALGQGLFLGPHK